MKLSATLLLVSSCLSLYAQDYRWQQRVEYKMEVALNTNKHLVKGHQKLTYFNNSPDTLSTVYYHLYFNAFQPGSMMDVRSRTIADPDSRVMDRIAHLSEKEIGYQHVLNLTQDGKPVKTEVDGTLLKVALNKPILPRTKTVFEMDFEAQVPLQIRRSGRDNKEGIEYSMTQWYPKLAEYDYQGWHAYQYVAREFHGVWGDYDVTINIDPAYTIAASGILQNPEEIGHGYESGKTKTSPAKGDLSWHFIAKDVHDFAWAADPDYKHTRIDVPDGPVLHFFYQPGDKTNDSWSQLPDYASRHFQFMNRTFGKYPYASYSIIQGGDGGMEYPMCTLITGERSLKSLVGVTAHEAAHAWFQGVLGSNESLYPWMDEGFTDFASNESMSELFDQENSHQASYNRYFKLYASGLQEPMSQNGDHYNTNVAYGTAAYSMGAIFLEQLKYIVGKDDFYEGMRRYFNTWKFRHPEPNDFVRIMEKETGLQLHWYLRHWIYTTKHIDYGIDSIGVNKKTTTIKLRRIGDFPMPIEVEAVFKDGSHQRYNIPMNEMLGHRRYDASVTGLPTWYWVNPSYTFDIEKPASEIVSLEIDPDHQMADINQSDNRVVIADRINLQDHSR